MTTTKLDKFKQNNEGAVVEAWGSTPFVNLNSEAFSFQNGLWKGKSRELSKAVVIRGANFKVSGKMDAGELLTLLVDEKQLADRELLEGDILIERSGGGPNQPVGRVAYFDVDEAGVRYSFSNFTARLRILDRKAFVPQFVFYRLMHFYSASVGNDFQSGSTGIRNLDFSKYKDEGKIPLLDIKEQKRIVEVLAKNQKVIENQERIVSDLRELKSTTTAKLFHEGLRGELLKQTEIGEVPKSWAVKRLGDVASLQGGFAFKSGDYKESGIRLFKIANVSFGKTIWDDMSFLPATYLELYRDYALKSGDIVMAMTRPIVSGGIKIAIASKNDTPCLLNQRVGRFLLKEDIDPNYFYSFLFSDYFIRHIVVGADGAQQPNISSKKIEEALIPYPPLQEQIEIASTIQSISKSYDCNVEKLKELRALFFSTLNQLMAGKVRVG